MTAQKTRLDSKVDAIKRNADIEKDRVAIEFLEGSRQSGDQETPEVITLDYALNRER